MKFIKKTAMKLMQRQKNSRFTPDLKIVIFVLIPNFTKQEGISKSHKPLEKDQIIS